MALFTGNNHALPHVTGHRRTATGELETHGLLEWHHLYYDGFLPADIQRYWNRGNFVDQCANLLGQGKTLHLDTLAKAAQEEWTGFIDAYRRFLDEEEFIMTESQVKVIDRVERFVGTLDQHGRLRGEPFLLDLKTGTAPKWTGLQLAFYALALSHRQYAGASREYSDNLYREIQRAALELHADGTYKLIRYNSFKDFDKARLLARAYWTAQEYL